MRNILQRLLEVAVACSAWVIAYMCILGLDPQHVVSVA